MVNTNILKLHFYFFSGSWKIFIHTFDLIGIPEPTNKSQLKFRRMLYQKFSKEFSNQKKGYKENHKDNINVGMGGCNWIITNIIMSRMSLIIWDEPSKKIHVKNFKISGWYMDDTWANMRHKGFGNHKTTSQTIITNAFEKNVVLVPNFRLCLYFSLWLSSFFINLLEPSLATNKKLCLLLSFPFWVRQPTKTTH